MTEPEADPPTPNREPVREGVREIDQTPDLFADEPGGDPADSDQVNT